MIEPLSFQHIEEVTDIHLTSWAPYEISVKLGKEYLKECFYPSIIKSEFGFGYIYIEEGKIIAYATGFRDYNKFFLEIKNNNFFRLFYIFLTRILYCKIGFSDILNIFIEHRCQRKIKYLKYHQNGLALRNEFKGTEIGRKAITSSINKVIEQFIQEGYPGCWGISDNRNIAMKKFYLRLGFKEIDSIKQFNRKQVVFEKIF